ncbi:TonB-dependent receptor plug domain-containing protein [Neisseria perflava]|uniref:TonB-dependent receptor plug domain-containing protein n=1 Tax=Neisseria perflava TaxID=33053 RepID=UPI00209F1CFA|nr:TonB-dependent receptor plug domain-containing protein [Neisseria perflava]MCP1661245.1 outer membrane receptor protein involved in Fe transport [Neisseria perflava]
MPDGQGATSNIDINSLGRVEVLKGPFSSLYGNSSSGAILMETEGGAYPPQISVDSGFGSYGSYHYGVKASGMTESGSLREYVVSANRFTTEGYRDHSGARKNQANMKLT